MLIHVHHTSSFFFLSSSGAPPDLHSFPTRRSSDLVQALPFFHHQIFFDFFLHFGERFRARGALVFDRSEEHTSELQSRFDLVCRLLLEKKNRSGRLFGTGSSRLSPCLEHPRRISVS